MTYSSDKLFNLAWGLVGVMVGISILLWAMDVVEAKVAIAIWILSVGLILFGLGFVKTDKAERGSLPMMAFGGFVVAVASGIFGVVLDLIPDRDYDIRQEFFQEESVFLITVSPVKGRGKQ